MSKRLFREVARLTPKPNNYQFVDNDRFMTVEKEHNKMFTLNEDGNLALCDNVPLTAELQNVWQDVRKSVEQCREPEWNLKTEAVYKLNNVVEEISNINSVEMEKLKGVMEFADRYDSESIVKLINNLDEFTFYPDVIDEEELGRAMIEENEDYRIHEDVADFFMFEQYGEAMMNECDCKFTENGAVLLKNKTLTEILGEEQNNAMTMGGM